MKRRLLSLILATAMVLTLLAVPVQGSYPAVQTVSAMNAPSTRSAPNYAELLQYSLYFFDSNMCGADVGTRSAFAWRDNCHLQDATIAVPAAFGGGTIDLTGGFHDAGDHVKFGIPGKYSAVTLGWAYYEFEEAFTTNGLEGHARRILDHFAEFYRKAVIWNADGTPRAFAYQVGDGGGGDDHGYWGPPESQTGSAVGARRIGRFTNLSSSSPGTDQVAFAAAVLAQNYVNFGNPEDLRVAQALFTWAWDSPKGLAREGTTPFYQSSRWDDKIALAAEWLFIATTDSRYTTNSNTLPSGSWDHHTNHQMAWDGVWQQVNALRGSRGGVPTDRGWGAVATNMNRVNTSSNSFFEPASWGNNRYNTAFQMLGLIHDKHTGQTAYTTWSDRQMRFILGDNNVNGGTSFVVGINGPWATNAHHRASHGGDWSAFNDNRAPRHILTGALIGGTINGQYVDHIREYTYTEVAIDFNASLAGAAAGLWMQNKTHRVPSPVPTTGEFREVAGGPAPCTDCNNTRCTCPKPCPTCGENQPCGNAGCAPPEPCDVCDKVGEACDCPEVGITVVRDIWRCTSCNADKQRITTTLVTFNATARTYSTVVRVAAKRNAAGELLASCTHSKSHSGINQQPPPPPPPPACTTCNATPCTCGTPPPPPPNCPACGNQPCTCTPGTGPAVTNTTGGITATLG
ncbi:MAG: glycoside hydrolase family 9 protein, partial [Oscillospiraceae bacterium]|nr:glycoside hydrolase family 9 protein [Oscillospiraceae bacterium]